MTHTDVHEVDMVTTLKQSCAKFCVIEASQVTVGIPYIFKDCSVYTEIGGIDPARTVSLIEIPHELVLVPLHLGRPVVPLDRMLNALYRDNFALENRR